MLAHNVKRTRDVPADARVIFQSAMASSTTRSKSRGDGTVVGPEALTPVTVPVHVTPCAAFHTHAATEADAMGKGVAVNTWAVERDDSGNKGKSVCNSVRDGNVGKMGNDPLYALTNGSGDAMAYAPMLVWATQVSICNVDAPRS